MNITNVTPHLLGGVGEKKSNGGTQYYQQDRVYSINKLGMCLPALGSYLYLKVIVERNNDNEKNKFK